MHSPELDAYVTILAFFSIPCAFYLGLKLLCAGLTHLWEGAKTLARGEETQRDNTEQQDYRWLDEDHRTRG